MKPGRVSTNKNQHPSDDIDTEDAHHHHLQPQYKVPTKRMTASEFFSNTNSPASSTPNTPSPQKKTAGGITGSSSKVIQPYYVKRTSISSHGIHGTTSSGGSDHSNSMDAQSSAWQELSNMPGITIKKRRGSNSSVGSHSDASSTVNSPVPGSGNINTNGADYESLPEGFDQQIFHELQYPKLRKSNEATYTRKTKPRSSGTPTKADQQQGIGKNKSKTNVKKSSSPSKVSSSSSEIKTSSTTVQPAIPPPPGTSPGFPSLMNTFIVLDDHEDNTGFYDDDEEATGKERGLDEEIDLFAVKAGEGEAAGEDDSFYNDTEEEPEEKMEEEEENSDHYAYNNPMHTKKNKEASKDLIKKALHNSSTFSIEHHEEDEIADEQEIDKRRAVEEEEITVDFKNHHGRADDNENDYDDEEDEHEPVTMNGKRAANGYTSLSTERSPHSGSSSNSGRLSAIAALQQSSHDEYYNPFSSSANNFSSARGDIESGTGPKGSSYLEISHGDSGDEDEDYDDRYDVSAHNSLTSTTNVKVDRYRERGNKKRKQRGNSSGASSGGVTDVLMGIIPQSVQDWSNKYPRLSIATLISIILILPLFITVIVLASSSSSKNSLNTSNTGGGDSSNAATWSEFYTSSYEGIVATDTKQCSEIGRDILKQGGNAVDAAIASTFCLGVISPASSGIGGGCYILIHQAKTNKQTFIDAREVAPGAAYPTMFENDPMKAQLGGSSIAVLGEVKGLYRAYALYGSGKISWRNLVLPAATLAKRWTISRHLYFYLVIIQRHLLSSTTEFVNLRKLYTKKVHGQVVLKEVGDYVEQPELAQTLENIANHGPDYLYVTMAETMAKEIQSAGGYITKEDIMQYEPVIMDALKVDLAGYQYIGVGGSSSGGIIVVGIIKSMLSYLEPLTSLIESLYTHRLVESMKHLFAMRLSLGDPNYVNVTEVHNAILSDSYLSYLQHELTSDDSIQSSLYNYGGKFNMNAMMTHDAGTSHISVLDAEGNAVAMTTTVNNYFGSKVVSSSTGILFNNEMDDFSVPGASNYFGLAPSPYNYPEPYKKPLSSMSPSIVLDKKNRVRVVGGGSGGPRIITATAQVLLNYLGRGMDILSSTVHPRVHSQLLPDKVDVEDRTLVSGKKIRISDVAINALKSRGHHNVTLLNDSMGVTQFIVIDPDTGLMEGVSDPRKDGAPAGI